MVLVKAAGGGGEETKCRPGDAEAASFLSRWAEDRDPGPRVRRGAGRRPPLSVAFRPTVEFVTGGGGRLCVFFTDERRVRARGLSPILVFGGLLFDPEPCRAVSRVRYLMSELLTAGEALGSTYPASNREDFTNLRWGRDLLIDDRPCF